MRDLTNAKLSLTGPTLRATDRLEISPRSVVSAARMPNRNCPSGQGPCLLRSIYDVRIGGGGWQQNIGTHFADLSKRFPNH